MKRERIVLFLSITVCSLALLATTISWNERRAEVVIFPRDIMIDDYRKDTVIIVTWAMDGVVQFKDFSNEDAALRWEEHLASYGRVLRFDESAVQ